MDKPIYVPEAVESVYWAARKAIYISDAQGVDGWFEFNGIKLWVSPGFNATQLAREYDLLRELNQPRKVR